MDLKGCPVYQSLRTSVTSTNFNLSNCVGWVIAFVWLAFTASLAFDLVHHAMHKCARSKNKILRAFGRIHQIHHIYFNRRLEFNRSYTWINWTFSVPCEVAVHVVGLWLGWKAAVRSGVFSEEVLTPWVAAGVMVFVLAKEGISFVIDAINMRKPGFSEYPKVPKDSSWFLVGNEMHALHHVDPSNYMGSTHRFWDWLTGSVATLPARSITIVGGDTDFGAALKKQLRSEACRSIRELRITKDLDKMDIAIAKKTLADTDVLILAHGSTSDVNTRSDQHFAEELIRMFKQHRSPTTDKLLPEIWYVGNKKELYAKSTFTSHAKSQYYDESEYLYRHIVPTPVDAWYMSTDCSAYLALWFIKRGARFVPSTTLTGWLEYMTFVWWVRKEGDVKGEEATSAASTRRKSTIKLTLDLQNKLTKIARSGSIGFEVTSPR